MRQTKHPLELFNTMSGKLERFTPSEKNRVKIYTCGPSVYMQPHIGNYKTFLFEDLLQRYLEYSGYNVTRLMTVTDVEDKAIAEAKNEKISLKELTERNTEKFLRDMRLLKMLFPLYTAKFSTSIDQAAAVTKKLLAKGYAYRHMHEGRDNVYYDPLKFRNFGRLSRLDMSRWPVKKRRFHFDTYPGTPWNRGDFILWHGYRPIDRVCWSTEIGKGRPSWNVQDAAMIIKHFAASVDIASGAVDNMVRHHDYTIAVAESFTGRRLARYWLHAKHSLVDGKKMSKSKGNITYLQDLFKKGYTASEVRLVLLSRHYRKTLNFTMTKLDEARQKLNRLRMNVNTLQSLKNTTATGKEEEGLVRDIVDSFETHMNHDLDIETALEAMFKIVSSLRTLAQNGSLSSRGSSLAITSLRRIDEVLQVVF
jgi:cysteinyl-tRNA synthetase